MTLQELADIALGYAGIMADALLAAVVAKAYATGERVEVARKARPSRGPARYDDAADPFHAEAAECMAQRHGVTWDG